jgi:GAF domain-containing protein
MTTKEQAEKSSHLDLTRFMEAVERIVEARSQEQLADSVLFGLSAVFGLPSTAIYFDNPQSPQPRFYQQGLQPDEASKVKRLCDQVWKHISDRSETKWLRKPLAPDTASGNTVFYPLPQRENCAGMLCMIAETDTILPQPEIWEKFVNMISHATCRLGEWEKTEKQLAHLNIYLTVSSMLSQQLGLRDLLESALYCCMEVATASEASVLLLDDEREKFQFYQTEGPAKPILMGASFPADRGLAGYVLRSRKSEVINDVQNDPRFYGQIDHKSGFKTRNMIAIPLIAGEEPVGVLEVLNKVDGGNFTEEEHRRLLTLADEIAFAIRNAKIFDYVVDSYCKQRQGQNSCKGCKRPLGSWTPCVKYRESIDKGTSSPISV